MSRSVATALPEPSPASSRPPRSGAAPVGSARYPVPYGTLVVSPRGDDSASGTLARPLRTVGAAIARAPDGGTVVMRQGSYHESVLIPPGKRLVIQPYPGEAAWFDGARRVGGWQRDGSAWRARDWNVRFDRSPTYLRGAPDNTEEFWRFVSEEHPLAAHPEMLWIDGVEQRQVATRGEVRPGTFWVDDTRGERVDLVIGSRPQGRRVEASALATAISLRAPGTVLRGIGVRRYGSSVPDQGVITSYFPAMTIDNVTVEDSGTGAIGMFDRDNTVRNTTVRRSGQLAVQANHADNLMLESLRLEHSNTRRFNTAPAAGGVKITASRGITLRDSLITDTSGHAVWADESAFDIVATGNDIREATGNGIYYELSSKGLIADNHISGTGADGISVRNTDKVAIWNNTVRSRNRAVDISQDHRLASAPGTTGHDTRRRVPDPDMTWLFGDIRVSNNVLEGGGDALVLLGVQNFTHRYDASERGITVNGNVYGRPTPGSPRWLIAWSRVGTDPYVYTDLATFAAAQGQERTGHLRTGASVFDRRGRVLGDIAARTSRIADPLPSHVADRLGRGAGTRHLGAWR